MHLMLSQRNLKSDEIPSTYQSLQQAVQLALNPVEYQTYALKQTCIPQVKGTPLQFTQPLVSQESNRNVSTARFNHVGQSLNFPAVTMTTLQPSTVQQTQVINGRGKSIIIQK